MLINPTDRQHVRSQLGDTLPEVALYSAYIIQMNTTYTHNHAFKPTDRQHVRPQLGDTLPEVALVLEQLHGVRGQLLREDVHGERSVDGRPQEAVQVGHYGAILVEHLREDEGEEKRQLVEY